MCIETAVIRADNTDALHILACAYTAAAENTFLIIANKECRALIVSGLGIFTREMLFVIYAVVAAELLELAVLAADAGETFSLMSGKNKLEVCLSVFLNLGSICKYLHALVYRSNAGGHESARALYLYKAEAACAYLVYALEIAERGDINLGGSGSFENGGILRNAVLITVYFYINHIHSNLCCSFLMPYR